MRRILSWLTLVTMLILSVLPISAAAEGQSRVYVLHVDGWQTIDPVMAQMTKRAIATAEADPNSVGVAIIIDTPGGLVESALEMQKAIVGTKQRTVALVADRALSAGALVATAAEKLYMSPSAEIGAAEPRLAGSTESADYKTVAAVAGAFRSTAEARGRDPEIAVAMVDRNAKVPWQKGELLVMTAKEAVEHRYADGQATDLAGALKQAGITYDELVDIEPTFSEQLGRFLTTPIVAILLLVVGVIALGIEFMKPGVTVPGLIGIVSLSLFFIGNMLAGSANWLELGLALLGILLLIIEAFIPGFGIFGIGGAIAMGGSIFLAVPSRSLALQYLMWVSLAFLVALFGIVRAIGRRGLGKALTLEQDAKGWVPERADLSALMGQQGVALTTLRPAGTARFGAQKVDVVTEGEFVDAGSPVKVIEVDGTRVVVRATDERSGK